MSFSWFTCSFQICFVPIVCVLPFCHRLKTPLCRRDAQRRLLRLRPEIEEAIR